MKKDKLKGKQRERKLSYFKCAKELDMSVIDIFLNWDLHNMQGLNLIRGKDNEI